MRNDPEATVADYFASFEGGGMDAVRYAVRHPIAFLRAQSGIARLRTLDAQLVDEGDADVVRIGLYRPHPLARRAIRGTTAVLELTEDYLLGSSASKRSLRTKYNKATRRGYQVIIPKSLEERRHYLAIAAEFERTHPFENYRRENPDNEWLLEMGHWFIAADADGKPLLLCAPGISGDWAVLQYFKMMEDSDDARLARFWMAVELVEQLRALGVRYLADMLSPIGLPPGLRDFQRRLGYRLVRVHIHEPAAVQPQLREKVGAAR